MIENEKPQDGLLFVDENNPNDFIIFNFYTWVSIIKGIMVFYGQKTEDEAQRIINNTPLFTRPPQNYLEASLLGHEEEYYWAMVMSHGERFFDKGYSYTAPEGYLAWEDNYIQEHNLAKASLFFND
ncbi:hypothetical protein GA0061071_106160 [Kosakonia oryzendophytica]|uniref:Uncharacterized protein n=1 Tax=Kosakonia oryzendophytica TaxID=1005665 RepID=A0A1C4C120_9ENTR|nr:hypothetical protein [Kosakonia oryzendophytica]SCC12795.1 hypothetical protein GA0061071_106160 [Kosakonia oryzendophytica]